VTVIDAKRAWVVEQHVYNQAGTTLLASAIAESHRYYDREQVSLPERVAINLPASGLSFKIDLGVVGINQLAGDRQQLWTLPTFEGYPQFDLGGAAPGTPLPGQTTTTPHPSGVLTASFPGNATTGFPETTAPYNATLGTTDIGRGYRPLPQYGRPNAAQPAMRR
jgi:hypothetical protein